MPCVELWLDLQHDSAMQGKHVTLLHYSQTWLETHLVEA